MKQYLILLFFLGFATAWPTSYAPAQTARGAVSGAIIGGAVGGRRGAAIGATAGAVAGAHRRHRHWNNYYWRHGQCWYRSRSGRSHQVSHRYCLTRWRSPAAMEELTVEGRAKCGWRCIAVVPVDAGSRYRLIDQKCTLSKESRQAPSKDGSIVLGELRCRRRRLMSRHGPRF